MSSEWLRTTIGEQATLQRGFDITKAEQRAGAVPVVSSSGISSWHDTAMVNGPGVVLGRKGVVGSVHFVEQDFWPHDTSLWVKDFHGNDPRYVYYFFRAYAKELSALDVGSANPTLNRNHVHPIEVPWPSRLDEQRSIAGILGALDDRITLLRDTNATLEAIAQALFKSWFVDFDPVRAKMAGRAPEGMDEDTAALFPDALDETDLGLVPKGWAVQPLDEIANYLNGLALQKFPPTGVDDLPVIKIAQLRKGDTGGADKAARTIKPEYIIQNGDVLFSWSGSLEVDIWCGGEGALNQHLFKVTSQRYPKWFYYLWTKHHLEHFRQVAASKATTMGHIQRSHLSDAKAFVPSHEVLASADQVLSPMLDRIVAVSLKASTLSDLRDTLLPRLISGQLRLPEAQAQLEHALA
jgi:type I restriction enzyme, S subunit